MEQQNNFPFFDDPMIWQGSQKEDWPGNANYQFQQAQPGSFGMTRDFSSQSNNTTDSGTSFLTNATTCSAGSTNSTQDLEDRSISIFVPGIKIEKDMYPYTSAAGYSTEHHYGDGGTSPATEQLNYLEDMSLYHQPHSFHNPSDFQQGIASSNPGHYPQSFSERSNTPPEKNDPYSMDNYHTHDSQSMTGHSNNGGTLGVYRPPSVPSNGHSGYASSQPGDGPTPTSLGWAPGTELVKKYKLVLFAKNNLYLDIIDKSDIALETPVRVYLENVPSSSKGEAHCPWPGKCDRREPFGRQADLERHLKNVHGSPDSYPCPHTPCLNNRHRIENAFTRKDHLRDHLRDFHQEDIGAAKGEKNARTKDEKKKWAKEQEKWVDSRKISASHWRCAKCLLKKSVAKHGWQCGECNQPCEPERIERRRRLVPSLREEAQVEMDDIRGMTRGHQQTLQDDQYAPTCATCYGDLWVDGGYGKWEPCSTCNYDNTQVGSQTFR